MIDGPIDAQLDLLDRLVVDRNGVELGRVDDLELLVDGDAGTARVVALLVGPQAWGRRFGHRLGRWVEGVAAALRHGDGPVRVPVELVAALEPGVRLHGTVADVPRALTAERWLRRWFIGRIPGGRHEDE